MTSGYYSTTMYNCLAKHIYETLRLQNLSTIAMEPFKRLLLINKRWGMKTRALISFLALAIWLLSTSGSKLIVSQDQQKGLKDYYAAYFSMGVAVSPRALKTDE